MIKPEQVPMEVCEALQNALLAAFSKSQETTYNRIIAAALNAWPGMEFSKHLSVRDDGEGYCLKRTGIHLPLPPQENSDE